MSTCARRAQCVDMIVNKRLELTLAAIALEECKHPSNAHMSSTRQHDRLTMRCMSTCEKSSVRANVSSGRTTTAAAAVTTATTAGNDLGSLHSTHTHLTLNNNNFVTPTTSGAAAAASSSVTLSSSSSTNSSSSPSLSSRTSASC